MSTIFDSCVLHDLCIVCRQKITDEVTIMALPIRQSFAVHPQCKNEFQEALKQIESAVNNKNPKFKQLALSICRAINNKRQ